MVSVNPVLSCLMAVEEGICRGDGVRDSLLNWLDRESRSTHRSHSENEFHHEVQIFLRQSESGDGFAPNANLRTTAFRRSLMSMLVEGVSGNSILTALRELRSEIEMQLELDLKAHVESLPLKMLVPLLLFMFPAFLILLLGPITQNFMESMR